MTRPARYSLACWARPLFPQLFPLFVVTEKWSGYARLHARVVMEGGLLSVWVSQGINCSRSMDIATFSTWDLREQGCKSYIAIVIEWMKNCSSCKCFLANYVSEGDLQKISSMNDSQYTVFLFALMNSSKHQCNIQDLIIKVGYGLSKYNLHIMG